MLLSDWSRQCFGLILLEFLFPLNFPFAFNNMKKMMLSPTKVYRKCAQIKSSHQQAIARFSESTQTPPKTFESIPGPKTLPFIGSVYNYLPGGKYYNLPLHESGMLKYQEYGKLVRETFLPGKTVLWVFDPNDMETLFLNEFRFPERRSHLAFKKYRQDRPHIYNDGGLLPTNGEEWWRLRKEFQKGLSALPCVRSYFPISNEIIAKFVQKDFKDAVLLNRNQDFLPLVSRLFLQLVGIVAFDVDLNSFTPEEIKPDSKSSRLLKAVEDANSLILPLDDSEEKWTKMETKKYRQFVKAVSIIEEVAVELVQKKAQVMKSNPVKDTETENQGSSLLEMYLSSTQVDVKDVVGMALDLLLAGIDTTAYTSCYALYHLSTNQEVQYRILQEAIAVLGPPGSGNPITCEILGRIPYTRSVLKEVFRLSPISVGVGRVTTQDMLLSGYHIPAKTQVVTQNQVACRLKTHFHYPDKFIPERWVKGHHFQTPANPYVALPFGHGPRACIARRLAEQHLLTLILRFVHNFNVSWAGKAPLGCKMGHINRPDKPVVFKYTLRV